MAIVFNGTTIPETGTIKWGNENVTEVRVGSETVWRKQTSYTQTFGNHTYVNHVGTPEECNSWDSWTCTLTNSGVVTSIYLGAGGNCRYRVYGRETSSSSWVLLLSEFTMSSAGTKTITNAGTYKYVRLDAYGVSRTAWEEPAGNYYWKEATNFKVTYNRY